MSSQKTLRFICDAKTAYRLHLASLKSGRCKSDLIRAAIKEFLNIEPAAVPDVAADEIEFEKGGKATALYLSGPIALQVEALATSQDRSRSWIVRSLLREALKLREQANKNDLPAAS
jgi:predicted transcriptional regulator